MSPKFKRGVMQGVSHIHFKRSWHKEYALLQMKYLEVWHITPKIFRVMYHIQIFLRCQMGHITSKFMKDMIQVYEGHDVVEIVVRVDIDIDGLDT
jgi:hypothetical protein